MAYQDWFDNWQRGEIHLRGYFRPPEELTAGQIAGMDRSAAHLLEKAEELAEELRAYRQALAERYAALEVMPYRTRLELKRVPLVSGKIRYLVRITREYEDGTEVRELEESFPGTDRSKAFARFRALQKERPGIEAVQDTARRGWER